MNGEYYENKFEEYLIDKLNFESKKELEYALELSMTFQLNKSMMDSTKKIIRRTKIDSITAKNYDSHNVIIQGSDYFYSEEFACPLSFKMSKPVFDKNFTIAIIKEINNTCSDTPIGIFRLKNGKRINCT